jgi:hypothetical protein
VCVCACALTFLFLFLPFCSVQTYNSFSEAEGFVFQEEEEVVGRVQKLSISSPPLSRSRIAYQVAERLHLLWFSAFLFCKKLVVYFCFLLAWLVFLKLYLLLKLFNLRSVCVSFRIFLLFVRCKHTTTLAKRRDLSEKEKENKSEESRRLKL